MRATKVFIFLNGEVLANFNSENNALEFSWGGVSVPKALARSDGKQGDGFFLVTSDGSMYLYKYTQKDLWIHFYLGEAFLREIMLDEHFKDDRTSHIGEIKNLQPNAKKIDLKAYAYTKHDVARKFLVAQVKRRMNSIVDWTNLNENYPDKRDENSVAKVDAALGTNCKDAIANNPNLTTASKRVQDMFAAAKKK